MSSHSRERSSGSNRLERDLARLVRLVDGLEARTVGYLTLAEVRQVAGGDLAAALDAALAEELLLVDHRRRLDEGAAEPTPVTLCRLNRHHPLVQRVAGFD